MTISFNKKRGNEMAMAINFIKNPRPLTRTKAKKKRKSKKHRDKEI